MISSKLYEWFMIDQTSEYTFFSVSVDAISFYALHICTGWGKVGL